MLCYLLCHQLCHMQVCTALQTDSHASTPPLSFLQAACPSCCPTNRVKALEEQHWKSARNNEKTSPSYPSHKQSITMLSSILSKTSVYKTAFSLEHANATYFIICIPEHAETGFLQDFTAEPITVTICCITNSNRLHHCCHLVNNFGHVGYSLYFLSNGPRDVPKLLLLLDGIHGTT